MASCGACGGQADFIFHTSWQPLTQNGAKKLERLPKNNEVFICLKCAETMARLTDEVAERRSHAPERAKA